MSNKTSYITAEDDDGVMIIGEVTTVTGPAGICEVRITLDNDTFTISELSQPEGTRAGVNVTYVQLTGTLPREKYHA